jgi:hypothetical protein
MIAMAFSSLVVRSEPCTLYKPADIARAKTNLERYEWARKARSRWERTVSHLMEQDRSFVETMIGSLTPWTTYGNNCPACVGDKSSMGEIGIYKWDVNEPDTLTCKYCGTVYPNDAYPETGRLECPRMGQSFTYYETEEERAHPEDKSGKYAFRWASWPVHSSWSGLIRYYKAAYCMSKALPLAKLYAVTGDARYAERAIWILDRVARVYPGWLYHAYNGTFADCPPAEAAAELGRNPRGGHFPKEVIRSVNNLHQFDDYASLCNGFWGAGRFGTGSSEGSNLLNFTVAYDLIRDARGADGRALLDAETAARIENDLLLAGCADRENWAEINNKAGPNRALSAAVGIMFGRPASVRRALDGFEQLLSRCFHFDGFCRESPSYSGMHLSLMEDIPLVLRGYSDPAGYDPAEAGVVPAVRFEDLNPFERVSRYRLALESMVRMLAPGRRYPVIGDTHYKAGLSSHYAEVLTDWYGPRYAGLLETAQGAPLEERGGEYAMWYRDPDIAVEGDTSLPLRTEWFPGWQVGVLRAGAPHGNTALYLNGYAYHGHRHNDTLGLILYAYGRELVSDRGYIWDDPRNRWTRSTLAHNLVTVDGDNQNTKGRTSTLELFATGPGVEMIQVRGEDVYAQCSLYRRTCVLVGRDGGPLYALDVFDVKGGRLHQYGLVCNGKLVAPASGDLESLPREHKWLSHFRKLTSAVDAPLTWQDGDVYLDCRLLSPCDRVVVADAPGWRSDKGSELNAPPVQQMFAERELDRTDDQAAGLESRFVSLLEPRKGEAFIRAARTVPVAGTEGAWAVRVEHAEGVDWIVCTPGDAPGTCGPVTTDARLAVVRVTADGDVDTMTMVGGTQLRHGDVAVSLPSASTEFSIASTDGCSVSVPGGVFGDACPVGSVVLTGGTGFEVESCSAGTLRVRDYPVPEAGSALLMHSVSFTRSR